MNSWAKCNLGIAADGKLDWSVKESHSQESGAWTPTTTTYMRSSIMYENSTNTEYLGCSYFYPCNSRWKPGAQEALQGPWYDNYVVT
jgi:hypothetical protein